MSISRTLICLGLRKNVFKRCGAALSFVMKILEKCTCSCIDVSAHERPCPAASEYSSFRALGGFQGVGRFLMGKVPLYARLTTGTVAAAPQFAVQGLLGHKKRPPPQDLQRALEVSLL